MNWAEALIVMAAGVAGLFLFCFGYLTVHDGLAVAGIILYLATWSYSLFRVYRAEHPT